MSKKIVGYRVDRGTYEGKPYTNVKLSYIEPYSKNGFGSVAFTVKLSQSVFESVCEQLECEKAVDIIDKEIRDFYYDRYKNISGVFIS